jgi:hypothetical protein
MTIVSNDPSLWPFINVDILLSYCMRLSYQSVMSWPYIDLHFAVAAVIVVVYDWGEWDVVLKLPPFL